MRNLPNILTGIRITIIPILILTFYLPSLIANVVAALLFSIAAITDYFDGYLARAMKAQSNFGKCLDPIADKLIVIVSIVMLINFGNQDLWVLIPGLIIICREILISGLREFLADIRVNIPVSNLAKYKTAVQMVAIGLLLLGEKGASFIVYFMIGSVFDIETKILLINAVIILGKSLFCLASTLTIITGYAYFRVGLKNM